MVRGEGVFGVEEIRREGGAAASLSAAALKQQLALRVCAPGRGIGRRPWR